MEAAITERYFAPNNIKCCQPGSATCTDCLYASFCGTCIQGLILQKAFAPDQDVQPECCEGIYPAVYSDSCCFLVSLECCFAGGCAKSLCGSRFPLLAEHSSEAIEAGLLTAAKTKLLNDNGHLKGDTVERFCHVGYQFAYQVFSPCYCVPCKDAAYVREMYAFERSSQAAFL